MNRVVIDDSRLRNAFEALSHKSREKALKGTIRSQANILKRETDRRFAEGLSLSGTPKNKKFTSLNWGSRNTARVNVYKSALGAAVDIMRDFRAKFFESGTKDRYAMPKSRTTAGYRNHTASERRMSWGKAFRGEIAPRRYFEEAQRATEKKVFEGIESALEKFINRAIKQNKKNVT